MRFAALAPAVMALQTLGAQAQRMDSLVEIAAHRLTVAGSPKQQYLLYGDKRDSTPDRGYGLLIILPVPVEGDEQRLVISHLPDSLPPGFLIAGLIPIPAVVGNAYSPMQWPVELRRDAKQAFTTEQFIRSVIEDVKARQRLDDQRVYVVGWSNSGYTAYSAMLNRNTGVRGAFIMSSAFKWSILPPLDNAKGKRFYLLQSPTLDTADVRHADEMLTRAGATVRLATYEGGVGWRGDVAKSLAAGITWLDETDVRPAVTWIRDTVRTRRSQTAAEQFASAEPLGNTDDYVLSHLQTIERAFLERWFDAWAAGHDANVEFRYPSGGDFGDSLRLQTVFRSSSIRGLVHCHPSAMGPIVVGGARSKLAADPGMVGPNKVIVLSGFNLHAICPSWLLEPHYEVVDERFDIDAGIPAESKARIRAERAAILAQLERAAMQLPKDPWITGQRVRLLVDQRDTAGALRVVKSCAAAPWWCGLLDGYVTRWRGDILAADSIFTSVIQRAPYDTRCPLSDLSMLLPDSARASYVKLSCAAKEPVNATVWWLSDPLFSEPGNERRAEHYARLVLVMLHTATEDDGRYQWADRYGGVGVRSMMMRYGWPATAEWGGTSTDRNHQSYLGVGLPSHFTTNEYPRDRIHLLPSTHAILHPLAATADDWELSAKVAGIQQPKLVHWWPDEHFPWDRGQLNQMLGDQQVAMFRRDFGALLAVGTQLKAGDFRSTKGDAVSGQLITSVAPDSFTMTPMTGVTGGTSTARLYVESRPQVLGLEFLVDDTRSTTKVIAARTRFAITPPEPSTRVMAGAVAISDLAFVTSQGDDGNVVPEANATLKRMMGTLELAKGERVSIYWETYGVKNGDTLDVSFNVQRVDHSGVLRRIGSALGLVGKVESNVSVMWREPRPGEVWAAIPSRMPTLGRITTLNLGGLEAGSYRLTVLVKRPSGAQATSIREFSIRP